MTRSRVVPTRARRPTRWLSPAGACLAPVLALAMFSANRPAHACSCTERTHDKAIESADVAFLGVVLAVELLDRPALSTFVTRSSTGSSPSCPGQHLPPSSSDAGCVAAVVADGGAGVPIGATIALSTTNNGVPGEAAYSIVEVGCFRQCDLTPGLYRVEVRHDDRLLERDPVEVMAGETTLLELDLAEVSRPYTADARVLLQVEEAWKGTCAPSTIWVQFHALDALCGTAFLLKAVGERHAIFAKQEPGRILTNACTGTHRIGDGSVTDRSRPPPERRRAQTCADRAGGRGCAHCSSGTTSLAGLLDSGAPMIALLLLLRRRRR
jgi:MYXO-CTERM domain-containing protein